MLFKLEHRYDIILTAIRTLQTFKTVKWRQAFTWCKINCGRWIIVKKNSLFCSSVQTALQKFVQWLYWIILRTLSDNSEWNISYDSASPIFKSLCLMEKVSSVAVEGSFIKVKMHQPWSKKQTHADNPIAMWKFEGFSTRDIPNWPFV